MTPWPRSGKSRSYPVHEILTVAGVLFIAVGVDGMLLTKACRKLAASYR